MNAALDKGGKLNWDTLRAGSADYLVEWFESGDHRGIGITTSRALSQMFAHRRSLEPWETFKIDENFYDVEISAGNGILSRALPLFVAGYRINDYFRSWLAMTHLHEDGHRSVLDLEKYVMSGYRPSAGLSSDGRGFYAPDALEIAVNAVEKAANAFDVFRLTQRLHGDNDSTAALAMGLWALKKGWDDDLERQWGRMAPGDVAKVVAVI
jgi:ADP-ribosylglycohydrolase